MSLSPRFDRRGSRRHNRNVGRSIKVRNLARSLGLSADEVLFWLLEHVPAERAESPGDYVSGAAADAARGGLRPPPAAAPPVLVSRRCGDCLTAPVPAKYTVARARDPADCDVCGGSVNRRAANTLRDAFRRRGYRRLVVVGGGPGTADELRCLLGAEIDLRLVDGEAHRDGSQAEADLASADVVAIWGGTILAHKVSRLYTDRRSRWGRKIVMVNRRGAAALCTTVAHSIAAIAGGTIR